MPQTRKTFRVFVSSTFTDMRVERRILQKEVFPKLKALCESKGASFQDVDLRWGVNEEAQLDQKTMDICLGEIARCQRLSPKPNFIILLGDKYGWQPVPDKIPSSEMERILTQLVGDEKALVETWYWEDLNAIPPEYVLQPRGDEYRAYEDWQKVESRLREILRSTVARLPFAEEQRVKYFASATHQEIMKGALNPPPGVIEPEEHVFAYLRTIGLPDNAEAEGFADVSDGRRDAYSRNRLEQLKQDLKEKLPDKHVYEYGAEWKDGRVIADAQAFGARVLADLSSIIESQLEEMGEPDPVAEEIKKHEEFKQQRLEHFTGRDEALKAVADYLNGDDNRVFAIIGASGTGKTSLMAKAMELAESWNGVKTFRFLGTSSATSDAYRLLSGIISEIVAAYGVEMQSLLKEGEDETKFSTLRGLTEILPRCFGIATDEKPLLIFLDALDQLARDYASLSLDWLPREMPQHVKIVVSALAELAQKISHTAIYELGNMRMDEGKELLHKWLASANRTLRPQQKEEVIGRFHRNGTPLFLRLAFERARMWASYVQDNALTGETDEMLDGYFDVLEKTHGKLLVQKVCGYIRSAKYQGLTETEILGLLAFDREYWDEFVEHCHPDHRQEVQEIAKLPIVVWSRFFLDLEPYLTEREADGSSIISFYHRKFIERVARRYVSTHPILAAYFELEPLYVDEDEERPNIRKVIEQPYQKTLAEQWEDVAGESLANFRFLMGKAKANMVEGILEDYDFLWGVAPESTKRHLDLWRAFFTECAHILRRGNIEWPAYKILLQLAVEHADDSPLTIGAEQWLEERKCGWSWLRRIQRVVHAVKTSWTAILEGHIAGVEGALETKDGRFLSWSGDEDFSSTNEEDEILPWSGDRTLRLWDRAGKPLNVLEGHTGRVWGALETKEGHFLSWSSDRTLRLWGRHGKPFALLEGHTDPVTGALETKDGHFLSWSSDRTLRLWDRAGKPLNVLEGHTDRVWGALETKDGRFLSWSSDRTLRLWDNGKPFTILKGHTDGVGGALETKDGRFLSWSSDRTLRLWDRAGKPLNVLEGHTAEVEGALERKDGRFLSRSWDLTLRLWDGEGEPLAILEGHTGPAWGSLETKDGRLLSWAGADSVLRLWDRTGKPLNVLEGHTDRVWGALETKDGRFLSWSSDRTLRLWDRAGKPLTILEGHTAEVEGALETRDGHFLSWSGDKTLRFWDRDGKPGTIFKGHTEWIREALETEDGHFLSWSDDLTLLFWNRYGFPLGRTRIEGGRRRLVIYSCRENVVSNSCFHALMNRGCLTTFNEEKKVDIFWHGQSQSSVHRLKSDGLAVLSQANGQVCLLQIYHGNKPISVEELEKLHGIQNKHLSNPSLCQEVGGEVPK